MKSQHVFVLACLCVAGNRAEGKAEKDATEEAANLLAKAKKEIEAQSSKKTAAITKKGLFNRLPMLKNWIMKQFMLEKGTDINYTV